MFEQDQLPYVHLEDLLPHVYQLMFEAHTRRKLLPLERRGIFIALVDSLKTTVARCAAEYSMLKLDTGVSVLKTSDHFSCRLMSRTEVVELIGSTTGLDARMAELALLLIEIRTDTFLASSRKVEVEHLGTFSFHQDFHDSTEQQPRSPSLQELMLGNWVNNPGLFRESIWSRLFGSPAPARLQEIMEMMSIFRGVTRYEILLSAEVQLSPAPSESVWTQEAWAEP